MSEPTPSVYELVGGEAFFAALVEDFYQRIAADPRLRAMFPADLGPGKRAQQLFLMQYFGGPTTYSGERGHPRLRMRHAPFTIGPLERDAWLEHMLAALEVLSPAEPAAAAMRTYFRQAAQAMQNHFG